MALTSGKTLRIENPCGDVKIVGGFDEGHVVATARVKGSSVEDARDKANNYTLVIEESDDTVIIKQPDMSGLSVDLSIQIPAKRQVDVRAESGDVSILDIKSGARVTNRSGDVHLRQLNGTIEVNAYSGDIKIEDGKTTSLAVENKSGNIDLVRIDGQHERPYRQRGRPSRSVLGQDCVGGGRERRRAYRLGFTGDRQP